MYISLVGDNPNLKTRPRLKDALECLSFIKHKWYQIGTALEVDRSTIEGLSIDPHTNIYKLKIVITSWMDNKSRDQVTWEVLINAIEGKIIEEEKVAKDIEEFIEKITLIKKYIILTLHITFN